MKAGAWRDLGSVEADGATGQGETGDPDISVEVFQFMLAVAMEESRKARLINMSQLNGRIHCATASLAGDVYSVVGPESDDEFEAEMRAVLEGNPGGREPRLDALGR